MDDGDWLAERFEADRTHLRGWLTTVLARVGGTTVLDADLWRQRVVVDAFLAASRGGDLEALLAVLDPEH